ncbi:MAG: hypothetical protein MHM6MM_001174 [Cercozoa sp. M6MM]
MGEKVAWEPRHGWSFATGPGVARSFAAFLRERGWSEATNIVFDHAEQSLPVTVLWRTPRNSRGSWQLAQQNSQLLNHFAGSEWLTRKDYLLRTIRAAREKSKRPLNFMPLSFLLPRERNSLLQRLRNGAKQRNAEPAFIAKPAALARGRKISLIRTANDIERAVSLVREDDQEDKIQSKKRRHRVLSDDSPSRSMVVQKYVSRPLLVGGHKVDLRLYVLISSVAPLRVFLHKRGICRFSLRKYEIESKSSAEHDLLMHLTNASLHRKTEEFAADKTLIGTGCKWTLERFWNYVREHRGAEAETQMKLEIQHLVAQTVLAALPRLAPADNAFELFGFDVMFSEDSEAHLFEVNCSPALGCSESVDRQVKPKLVHDLLSTVLNQADHEHVRKHATKETQELVFSPNEFEPILPLATVKARAAAESFAQHVQKHRVRRATGGFSLPHLATTSFLRTEICRADALFRNSAKKLQSTNSD